MNLKVLLSTIEVECPFCTKKMKYEQAETHFKKQCARVPVKCQVQDCQDGQGVHGMEAFLEHYKASHMEDIDTQIKRQLERKEQLIEQKVTEMR